MSLFKTFLRKIVEQNKQIYYLLLLILDWLLVLFRVSKLDKPEADLSVVNTIREKQFLTVGLFISFVDYLYIYLSSFYTYINNYRNVSLAEVKTHQLDNNNFYKFNSRLNIYSVQQLFLYGLRSC